MAMLDGQPSMTQPTDLPCDSPHVVTRNRVPKVLPVARVTCLRGSGEQAGQRQPGPPKDLFIAYHCKQLHLVEPDLQKADATMRQPAVIWRGSVRVQIGA